MSRWDRWTKSWVRMAVLPSMQVGPTTPIRGGSKPRRARTSGVAQGDTNSVSSLTRYMKSHPASCAALDSPFITGPGFCRGLEKFSSVASKREKDPRMWASSADWVPERLKKPSVASYPTSTRCRNCRGSQVRSTEGRITRSRSLSKIVAQDRPLDDTGTRTHISSNGGEGWANTTGSGGRRRFRSWGVTASRVRTQAHPSCSRRMLRLLRITSSKGARPRVNTNQIPPAFRRHSARIKSESARRRATMPVHYHVPVYVVYVRSDNVQRP